MTTLQNLMKTGALLSAAISLLLASSTPALAGTQTTVFWVFDGCDSCGLDGAAVLATDLEVTDGGIHANAHGYVTFKTARRGGWDVTVKLFDAAPGFKYLIKSNHILLGEMTANTKGLGTFQFHVTAQLADQLGPNINLFSSLSAVHLFYAANVIYWE
ncbi:MAG: hypothetical protein AB9869_36100 [Verrucomicrobiia bacterium]